MNNPPTIGLGMIFVAQRFIQNIVRNEGKPLGLLFLGMQSIVTTSQGETKSTFQQQLERRVQAARLRLGLQSGEVMPRSTRERIY